MAGVNPFLEAVYFFWACWLLAEVEIHIEGSNGWAAQLPTWRFDPPWLLQLTNGKPVTGYHLYLNLFLITLFHLPAVVFGFSRVLEAHLISLYFLMTVVWDFQWFVWNPYWGPKRYFTDHVWWFPKRFIGLPIEYYTGYAASFAATALINPAAIGAWAKLAGSLFLLSAAAAIASAAFPNLKTAE
jgi:hypothetical protein